MSTLDQLEQVIAFFAARMGQLYGFRWKDWTDFKSSVPSADPTAHDQDIGVGDGTATVYQLQKAYASGGQTYLRPISKPVAGSVLVAVDGVEQTEGADFSVDLTTGIVTLTAAPANGVTVTAGFHFDVPVRFDTDRIETSLATFSAGDIPNVPVVEVRV